MGELTWVCGPEDQEACALTMPAAPTVVTWRSLQDRHAHSQWASKVAEWAPGTHVAWAPSQLSQSSASGHIACTWLISAVGRALSASAATAAAAAAKHELGEGTTLRTRP